MRLVIIPKRNLYLGFFLCVTCFSLTIFSKHRESSGVSLNFDWFSNDTRENFVTNINATHDDNLIKNNYLQENYFLVAKIAKSEIDLIRNRCTVYKNQNYKYKCALLKAQKPKSVGYIKRHFKKHENKLKNKIATRLFSRHHLRDFSHQTPTISLPLKSNKYTPTSKNNTKKGQNFKTETKSKSIGYKKFQPFLKCQDNISNIDSLLNENKKDLHLSISLKSLHPLKFSHFWKSSGFCPPPPFSEAEDYLLSQDVELNIRLIGALPRRSIEQVRIHWLFNMIKVQKIENGQPEYNLTVMEKFMDKLFEFRLKPGFEIMGNPSGIFNNFENTTQVYWWRDLVYLVAKRCIDRYGIKWVQLWNWESWNEPDHHDFDNLTFTTQGFLNYFDASREGLLLAGTSLKFGGPGGSCRHPNFSKLCWKLLEHCNNGSNFFHPNETTNITFISFHKKGQDDVDSQIAAELFTMSKIRERFRRLSHIPLFNDEGDFAKGWWRPRDWKADTRYATLVARSVSKHAHLILKYPQLRLELLSFDNAFLNEASSRNFFDQRTLLTRFTYNESNKFIRKSQFIKKPSYYVMGLLSLLGNQIFPLENVSHDQRLTILVTVENSHRSILYNTDIENEDNALKMKYWKRRKSQQLRKSKSKNDLKSIKYKQRFEVIKKIWETTILVSFSNSTLVSNETCDVIMELSIPKAVSEGPLYMAEYSMDERAFESPAAVWRSLGSPSRPTRTQLKLIRSHEGFSRSRIVTLHSTGNRTLTLRAKLSMPSVKLFHICSVATIPPPQVKRVSLTKISEKDVLLTWSDMGFETKCIWEYRIYRNPTPIPLVTQYVLIKAKIQLENSYLYSVYRNNETVDGCYTITAHMYDGTAGPPSTPACLGDY